MQDLERPEPSKASSAPLPTPQISEGAFASSSIAFGLSAPSPLRSPAVSSAASGGFNWGTADGSASSSTDAWGFGRSKKPTNLGMGTAFGARSNGAGVLRKQSLLASEMMMPGGGEDSQPNSHDEADQGDDTMSGTITAGPSFLQRPPAPFRSVSASSSASSLRASNAFSHYTSNPESFHLDRTNSFGITDESPSGRSASSSPFSIPAPASGSPSPWSSAPHLPRPEVPRRAASFSARPQSNSGLSNSWAPEGQRTPPMLDEAVSSGSGLGNGRSRMRSGSGSISGHSHSHSPSPFLQGSNSSPNSNKGSSGGQLPTLQHLRRRSSQPALTGFREFRQSLPPTTSETVSLPSIGLGAPGPPPTTHRRRRTSSMNSILGGRMSGAQELDDDVEFAQDTLDAFAMDGVARPDGPGASSVGMQRIASDSSGMLSDVSTGAEPGLMSLEAERSEQRRRGSTSAGQDGGLGVARMVRRKVNRADLLVSWNIHVGASSRVDPVFGQPRPKAHLRVAAQLSTEDISPDLLSEAEVHRRLRSGPSALPCNAPKAPGTPTSSLFPPPGATVGSNGSEGRPYSSHGRVNPTPTPNRFPEQAVDEDDGMREDDSSASDGDMDAGSVIGQGVGGSAFSHIVDDNAYAWTAVEGGGSDVEGSGREDDDIVGRRAKWTQFRGSTGGGAGVFVGSPGSERGFYRPEIEQDFNPMTASPSGGGSLALRPAKRKSTSAQKGRGSLADR